MYGELLPLLSRLAAEEEDGCPPISFVACPCRLSVLLGVSTRDGGVGGSRRHSNALLTNWEPRDHRPATST